MSKDGSLVALYAQGQGMTHGAARSCRGRAPISRKAS